jgi:hypothetical protein
MTTPTRKEHSAEAEAQDHEAERHLRPEATAGPDQEPQDREGAATEALTGAGEAVFTTRNRPQDRPLDKIPPRSGAQS